MNLRTNDLYWTSLRKSPRFLPLDASIRCNVAIVGTGITGQLAAYELLKAGVKSIVMLDRRDVCRGSILATTALLQYELDTPLVELSARVGQRPAERVYSLAHKALGDFEEIVDDLGGGCSFTRRRSVYLGGVESDIGLFHTEAAARRAIGIDVEYLGRAELHRRFGHHAPAALVSPDAAELDPHALALRLLAASIAGGVRVFAHTPVSRFEKNDDGMTLFTEAGHKVHAEHVVFAAGYESQEWLKQTSVSMVDSFVVVTEPVDKFDGWEERYLIWEARRPYVYARTTADGRIIIGGEDVPLLPPGVRDKLLPEKAAVLVEKFKTIFPRIPIKVAHTWAGAFAESDDGMPFIGNRPELPRAYFSLGYGGNGITFALIAARVICDAIRGVPNDDADIFSFDRTTQREAVFV